MYIWTPVYHSKHHGSYRHYIHLTTFFTSSYGVTPMYQTMGGRSISLEVCIVPAKVERFETVNTVFEKHCDDCL
jgi:hypothetical protein